MDTFSRRRFLALAGAGVVVVAGGTALALRHLTSNGQGNMLNFQAITGLPAKPMPSYASYVIGGQVNLQSNTGTITKAVYAGPPDETTTIVLLSRTVQVKSAQQQGNAWHITGVVSDPSLQPGEETVFDILLDPSRKSAQSTFFGSSIQLALQKFSAPS
jgi:hypothetical protein